MLKICFIAFRKGLRCNTNQQSKRQNGCNDKHWKRKYKNLGKTLSKVVGFSS
jgi:hypothetical protein